MIAFILRRVFQAVIVMLAVALVAFVMFRYMGDPITNLLGQEATVADRAAMMTRLGLDRPVPVQYLDFVMRAAQGDFGISYRMARPVSEVIMERLPATLELAFVSGLMALVFGIGFGVYTALNRDGWIANIIMTDR
jgi:peptide/nickel transport system permease protein